MNKEQLKFHVTNGFLCGPDGRWQISSIRAVLKRKSEKKLQNWINFTIFSFYASTCGATHFGVFLAAIALVVAICCLQLSTMNVYAIIDGKELELLGVTFIPPFWGEKAASEACDNLIFLITKEQNAIA